MNYREKFNEYEKGNLSEEEALEIERDIEKFSVLMDYFDEKVITEPVAVLSDSSDDFSFSEQIDKLINKRIKKSTLRIFLIAFAFVLFFLIGCGGTPMLDSIGLPQGISHFLFGLFSAAYYIVNFRLLYISFAEKKLKPAVFIIIWNIALIALTLIFSAVIGDAVAFAMPIVSGFSTLPQYFSDIFDSTKFYNVMDITGLSMIPLNIILSVVAIVFSKKSRVFRPFSKKFLKILISVFLIVAVVVSGISTAISYYRGFFSGDRLGAKLSENEIIQLDDVFIKSNPLDKTDEQLKEILEDKGYEYFLTNISYREGYYRKGRSDNMTASFYFGENNDENLRSLMINFAYECVSPYINQEKMQRIARGEYFSLGDVESDVMKELCSFGLYPYMLEYTYTYGERVTVCRVDVSVKKNTSYPNGFRDMLEFVFTDGVLTSFDGFLIDD